MSDSSKAPLLPTSASNHGGSDINYPYIASVIAAYWVISISMVYLNKMLLSNEDASIPAPLFVTWFQCLFTFVLCLVLGERYNSTDFPKIKFNYHQAVAVLPLSLVFVGMITFNNICLQYVAVSFYNVARSLSIVFNVIFTYFVLGKETSALTGATLIIVIIGFIVGIDGEVNFSLIGTLCGVLSSVFVSLNSIYTSKILPKVDNEKSLLLFYNNVNACLLFLPLIAIFEMNVIYKNMDKLFSAFFWLAMNITGATGFAIGLVTVMQVKATSPLTHNISGTAKAAVQSIMAFYIWGNKATVKGLLGIFFVLFGSGLYTWVQMRPITAPALAATKK